MCVCVCVCVCVCARVCVCVCVCPVKHNNILIFNLLAKVSVSKT